MWPFNSNQNATQQGNTGAQAPETQGEATQTAGDSSATVNKTAKNESKADAGQAEAQTGAAGVVEEVKEELHLPAIVLALLALVGGPTESITAIRQILISANADDLGHLVKHVENEVASTGSSVIGAMFERTGYDFDAEHAQYAG